MKSFQFSLERVLEWRAAQLLVEEAELRRLIEKAAGLEVAAARLEQSRLDAQDQVRHATQVNGWDLEALAAYCQQTDLQRVRLQKQLTEARNHVVAQREKLLVARRQHRLIEKLRERKLADWVAESSKEIEQLASETHLAAFVRRK